jgi:hypothetical protein
MKRIVVDFSEEEFEVTIDALEAISQSGEYASDICNDIIDKLYEGAKELS